MHWMFNCREVSYRISRSMDDRLSPGERLAVRMHLLMCGICRRYRKQLTLMRRMLRRLPVQDPGGAPLFKLDKQAKERMRTVLANHVPDDH